MYHISNHACERFIERGIDDFNITNAEKILKKLLKSSRPVVPIKKYHLKYMLSNKFVNAKYRYSNNWIFVIKDNLVLTVYKNTQHEFRWLDGRTIDKKSKGD